MLKGANILAYTAGIVDGEGCITITNVGGGAYNKFLGVAVEVGNTNPWIAQFLKINFGGHSYVKKHKNNPTWKNCHYWKVTSKSAVEFLKIILPYLQIKRPQAELAITFQSRKIYRTRNLTDEQRILNEADKILIQSWNRKGKEATA